MRRERNAAQTSAAFSRDKRLMGSSRRPGAKIGIIDRNGNGENHGVSKDVVVREAAQAGYELLDSQDFVKADGMDYFLILTAKPD